MMLIMICFPGEEDTGADPREAVSQSQVESVRKTLLQVEWCWSLKKNVCVLHVQHCFILFSLSFLCQAAAASVPAVHWDLHTVLCISPSEGQSRELHKFRQGQNHPHPEKTQCVLNVTFLWSDITIVCYNTCRINKTLMQISIFKSTTALVLYNVEVSFSFTLQIQILQFLMSLYKRYSTQITAVTGDEAFKMSSISSATK